MRLDPKGLTGPTPAQARSSQWRRSSHGFYVPADVDASPRDQRIVEAAAVIPAGGGAVTGWAALAWRGARWFPGTKADGEPLPVQLAMWDDIRAQPGFTVCHEGILPAEIELWDGLPVTSVVRTVCFLMRYARTTREAVGVADMAAYDDLASRAEMWSYALSHPAWTGIPRCREAMALCDENSWSPMETQTRLTWTELAELP